MPSTWLAAGFNVVEGHYGQVSLRAGVWSRDFPTRSINAVEFDVSLFGFGVGISVRRAERMPESAWLAECGLNLWRWHRQWRREVRYPLAWLCRLMPMRCRAFNPYTGQHCPRCGWTPMVYLTAEEMGNSPVSAPPR